MGEALPGLDAQRFMTQRWVTWTGPATDNRGTDMTGACFMGRGRAGALWFLGMAAWLAPAGSGWRGVSRKRMPRQFREAFGGSGAPCEPDEIAVHSVASGTKKITRTTSDGNV